MSAPRSRLAGAIRVVLAVAVGLSALFVPAGTLAWREAWILVVSYGIFVTVLVLRIRWTDPELFRERVARQREGKRWDRVLLGIYGVLLLGLLATAGLDAVRFRLTRVPRGVTIGAFLAFVPITVLFFRVYRENTFASKVVRVQTDRAQRVIETGPYRVVRHPMYVAIIGMMVLIPLALGSWLALVFSAWITGIFVLRTHLEDITLMRELPGYAEYATRTRYRLVPGIW
ncbi:MAG: isoprenylcysteine carboxylmethyltransferase family protein [Deltaproteobacteria bacterium]|nr:isoprenylcysteine carboxylmethyltransferase family protein [Deltaproteobacteria bacterium]